MYDAQTNAITLFSLPLLPRSHMSTQIETNRSAFLLWIPAEHGRRARGSRGKQLPRWEGTVPGPHRQRSDPLQEGCHVLPGQREDLFALLLLPIILKSITQNLYKLQEQKHSHKNIITQCFLFFFFYQHSHTPMLHPNQLNEELPWWRAGAPACRGYLQVINGLSLYRCNSCMRACVCACVCARLNTLSVKCSQSTILSRLTEAEDIKYK